MKQALSVAAVFCRASADPGPLARAEHIVYLSAFFNAEQRGMEYFDEVSAEYKEKSDAVDEDTEGATVAWVSVYPDASTSFLMNPDGEALGKGVATVFSFARYKTLLTTDAGGDLASQTAIANSTGAFANFDDIVIAQSEIGTRAETLKSIHAALQGVDILIDETYQFDPASAQVVRCLPCLLSCTCLCSRSWSCPFMRYHSMRNGLLRLKIAVFVSAAFYSVENA